MTKHAIMWRDKAKSLTLIELLIAVSITVLMLGASIPLFTKNARRQNLKNEAQAVAAFYSRARNYAFHPERVDVESYRVDGASCSDKGCEQLIINAVSGDIDDVEVDRLLMTEFYIKIPQDISFMVGDGKPDLTETKSIEVYFKSDERQKSLIEINPIGNIDVL